MRFCWAEDLDFILGIKGALLSQRREILGIKKSCSSSKQLILGIYFLLREQPSEDTGYQKKLLKLPGFNTWSHLNAVKAAPGDTRNQK